MENNKLLRKRFQLFKEWVFAWYGNHACYYGLTLFTGIPDGDDEITVLSDIISGEYDLYIDEMLSMYSKVRSHYGKYGFYVYETDTLYTNEDDFWYYFISNADKQIRILLNQLRGE